MRASEERLRQAYKMEAVGRLAGGIAHDFNNVLTAIFGYTDLLLEQLPADDVSRGDVQEIRRSAERAASLTRQLLAFGRKQVLQPRVLDVREVIAAVEPLLRGWSDGTSTSRALRRADREDPRRSRADRAGPDEPVRQRAGRDAAGRAGRDPGRGSAMYGRRSGAAVRARAGRLRAGHGERTRGRASPTTSGRTSSSRSSRPRSRAKGQGWGWRPSTGSSSRAAAGCTWTRTAGRRSRSTCRRWPRRRPKWGVDPASTPRAAGLLALFEVRRDGQVGRAHGVAISSVSPVRVKIVARDLLSSFFIILRASIPLRPPPLPARTRFPWPPAARS